MASENLEAARRALLEQIDMLSMDDSQKAEIRERVRNSSDEELVSMLKQQNEMQNTNDGDSESCIFCSIISKKVPSYKIAENDEALAVLEINPASKGHTIIIPKSHGRINEMSHSMKTMAKEVSEKLQERLSPDRIEISRQEMMGHTLFNILPIHPNTPLKKVQADQKELAEIQKSLTSEPIKVNVKKEVIIQDTKKPKQKKTEESKKQTKNFREKVRSRIP